jgi:hypothetical protein
MPRGLVLLATMLVVALAVPGSAAADVNDDRRALVMLRVLAYDKQLSQRVGNEVRVVLAYGADEAGVAEGERWMNAFAKLSKVKVIGRPVVVVAHKVESSDGLARALEGSAALLACDGVTRSLTVSSLAKLTRARHVLSFATRESEVAAGLSVAIVPGKRDEIVVNLQAAHAEGVKFDAGLLQLAREVKGASR